MDRELKKSFDEFSQNRSQDEKYISELSVSWEKYHFIKDKKEKMKRKDSSLTHDAGAISLAHQIVLIRKTCLLYLT